MKRRSSRSQRNHVGTCPKCGARLRIASGQRMGRCGRCRAMLGVRPVAPVASRSLPSTATPARRVLGRVDRRNPRLPPVSPDTREQIEWAVDAYQRFHGKAPTLSKVEFEQPKAVMLLGELHDFSYKPPLSSERGKTKWGKPIVWKHEMGDVGLGPLRLGKRPRVYIAESGQLIFTIGGSQKMNPELGVVG